MKRFDAQKFILIFALAMMLVFPSSMRAQNPAALFKIEMRAVPWGGRHWVCDGQDTGCARLDLGRRTENVGHGARRYHPERQEQDASF